jgi:hypothetical protein
MMKTDDQRGQALDRVSENIVRSGHHIYVVSGAPKPRFAYSIGVTESIGAELILAGGIFYMKDEVIEIINNIAAQLKGQRGRHIFDVAGQGSFTVRNVHKSWATELMLGASDYYQTRDILALQIVPDKAHWTIDVPDTSVPWNARTEPAWRWLHEPWTYPVPPNSVATTDLGALRGKRVTEAMRWEEEGWELFAGAGPDIPKNDIRVVPLGTLVASDESLVPVVRLPVGEGLWRDAVSDWHPWRQSQTT